MDLERRVAERTAQLQVLAVQLSQTEHRERHWLAKVLHDHLQQLLVGAKLHLGILRNQMAKGSLRQVVQQVTDLLDQSLETSRSLTVELSPPILQQGTMAQVLEWLVGWMHEKHDLSVQLQVDEQANPQREEVRILLFEAVRELLLNVIKHAKVTSAAVQMTRLDGEHVQVVVSDEGTGFDAAHDRPSDESGFGLLSMQQRLAAIAGRVDIESAPGRGTRVTLVVPADLAKPTDVKSRPAIPRRRPR